MGAGSGIRRCPFDGSRQRLTRRPSYERLCNPAWGNGVEPQRTAYRNDRHPVDRQWEAARRAASAGARERGVYARPLQPDAASAQTCELAGLGAVAVIDPDLAE